LKKALFHIFKVIIIIFGSLLIIWFLLGILYAWSENRNFKKIREKSSLNCNETPLHCFIKDNDIDQAKSYIKSAIKFEEKDGWGRTALFVAIQNNQLDFFNLLIAAKANPNTSNENGDTALFIAISQKKLDMAEALIVAGANVNALSGKNFRRTPLYYCVASEDIECTKLLLNHDANPRIKTSNGHDLFVFLNSKNEDLNALFTNPSSLQ